MITCEPHICAQRIDHSLSGTMNEAHCLEENKVGSLPLTLYKGKSKWIKDLNVKGKINRKKYRIIL